MLAAQRLGRRLSPRSRERGPVEAPCASRTAAPADGSPRSRERGPVEALGGNFRTSFSRTLRAHVSAAPLKRETREETDAGSFPLRAHVSAAPLKRVAPCPSGRCRRSSPRSRERGPVEATPVRYTLFVRRIPLRAHVSAAPLKRRARRAPRAPGAPSPRSRERGPVEATDGPATISIDGYLSALT